MAATITHVGSYRFNPAVLKVVPESPLVYWWDETTLTSYRSAPLIGDVARRKGMSTGDNSRFLRKSWEVPSGKDYWIPLVKGAEGREWFEPCWKMCDGSLMGLNSGLTAMVIRNPQFYLTRGVAFG